MAKVFKSIADFLSETEAIEKQSIRNSLSETEKEAQRILSSTSVIMSIADTTASQDSRTTEIGKTISDCIQESIKTNTERVNSLVEELFKDNKVKEERRTMWIEKLSKTFNIPAELSIDEKEALLDRQLAENSDSLNFAQFMLQREDSV